MKLLIDYMEKAGAFFLFVIMLLIATTAITRYLFNWPLPDGDAVSRLLLAIVVFWGFAAACLHDEHIQFDLIAEALPLRAKNICSIFALLITLGAVGTLTWSTLQRVSDFNASGQKTYELGLSLWPFYAIAWIGLLAAFVSLIRRLFRWRKLDRD